jgi:long-chain fatty acid transport protein
MLCRADDLNGFGGRPNVIQKKYPADGGLYIGEFGQPNQGASRAGANAIAEDASTAFQNPAGVMFLDGKQSMATGIVINSKSEFEQSESFPSNQFAVRNASGDGPASDGGDAGGTILGGAFFHARPVNDKWGWGFAFGSVSGNALDYEDPEDFAGRYWASEVDLLTVSITPSVSYKLTDDLAVSVHTSATYGELELDVYVPGPFPGSPDLALARVQDGDDIVVSYGASVLWQANDTLRLGLLYNSEIELDFESDLKIEPADQTVDANLEINYPQMLRASAAQDINEKLTLLASVAWEDWSSFEDVPIRAGNISAALPRNYDDTWHFALGLRWARDDRWTWYTGVAYDSDPTKASDRTADMPIDRQLRLSGGVTYERDNGHKIGGVLTLADYGDAEIDNGGSRPITNIPWTVKGEYDSSRLIFAGINYGW